MNRKMIENIEDLLERSIHTAAIMVAKLAYAHPKVLEETFDSAKNLKDVEQVADMLEPGEMQ
jgi:hypothetical protein